MGRARKHHQQQTLALPFPGRTRRNKAGGGRPAKPYARHHDAREQFDKLRPIHVTLRVVRGYENLRQPVCYDGLQLASKSVSQRTDFRIVQMSIEVDHVHLIVEADNNDALTRGIRAFQVSAAQRLNRVVGRLRGKRVRGRVFADRYHVRFITSPTQAHHTLNYVLNNWRRHDQDEASEAARYWDIDYMSSAISFDGWKELGDPDFAFRFGVEPARRLCVSPPRSWLLLTGWRKAGAISMYAVPGAEAKRAKQTR